MATRADALARREPGRGLAVWHRPLLHEGARGILAGEVRLARARDTSQPTPTIHRVRRRHRAAFHPRARRRAEACAAAAVAWLARLDRRIRAFDTDAHPSRALL